MLDATSYSAFIQENHITKGIISLILLGIIVSKIAGSSEGFTSGFLMLFYIGGPIIGGGAYLIFKWLPEKENEKLSRNRAESDSRMDSHRF